jgi:hypothetical protein
MTPHGDRCTPQQLASLDWYKPATKAAVFSSIWRIVRSSTESVYLPSGEHHRAYTAQFCSGNEQDRWRIKCAQGIPGSSRVFFIGSRSHYWGRRRYGPARLAFRMA